VSEIHSFSSTLKSKSPLGLLKIPENIISDSNSSGFLFCVNEKTLIPSILIIEEIFLNVLSPILISNDFFNP
jgi:hypothetical protein